MDEPQSLPVCWRLDAGPVNRGKLELFDLHLELEGLAPDNSVTALSVAVEEIARIHIGRGAEERIRGLPTLVLDRVSGTSLQIMSPVGFGAVQELGATLASRRLRRPKAGRLEVVIVGGGVAALEAMVALRTLAEERVEITLVSPAPRFVYRPHAVTQPFGGTPLEFSLPALAAGAGARLVRAEVVYVDTEARAVVTAGAGTIPYDALVVATGTYAKPAVPGAETFWGRGGDPSFARVLDDLARRRIERVAFAVPGGVVWSLPLYELALLTAARLAEQGRTGWSLVLVTPEDAPLALFEQAAGAAIAELLAARGIELRTGSLPRRFANGALEVTPAAAVPADRVVALPQLAGAAPAGLPADPSGYLAVDPYGHVPGCPGVFAAGDVTAFPVKQGGIATEQADAAASAIAAEAGAPVEPAPFRPVLRGLLLTGAEPLYLRTDLAGGQGATSSVAEAALWWPPAKIAGRYLGPYLAARAAEGAALRP